MAIDFFDFKTEAEHKEFISTNAGNWPSALNHPNENTKQDVETGKNLVFVVQGKISLRLWKTRFSFLMTALKVVTSVIFAMLLEF